VDSRLFALQRFVCVRPVGRIGHRDGRLESDLEFVMAQRMTAGKLWEVATNYESGR